MVCFLVLNKYPFLLPEIDGIKNMAGKRQKPGFIAILEMAKSNPDSRPGWR
jgi:hypothetical protein